MQAEKGIWPKDRQLLYRVLPLDTPLSMDFLISNVCNFKCNYCIQAGTNEEFERSGYKKELMSWDTFELGVKQIKDFPNKLKMLAIHGHGEPTLNPYLPEMINEIRKANISDKVVLITNGSKLTPEYSKRLIDMGLQEIRISLQGLSSEKYLEISDVRIDWEEFYSNIFEFAKIKNRCRLCVKIADTALGEGEEERFYQLFGEICDAVGVEHIYECFSHLGMDYSDVPRIDIDQNRWGEKANNNIKVCFQPFAKMDLSADGRFTNCCAALFGFEKNIRERSMIEQWNSAEMNAMRIDMLKHNLQNYQACQCCHIPIGTSHPEDVLDGHEAEILERIIRK